MENRDWNSSCSLCLNNLYIGFFFHFFPLIFVITYTYTKSVVITQNSDNLINTQFFDINVDNLVNTRYFYKKEHTRWLWKKFSNWPTTPVRINVVWFFEMVNNLRFWVIEMVPGVLLNIFRVKNSPQFSVFWKEFSSKNLWVLWKNC